MVVRYADYTSICWAAIGRLAFIFVSTMYFIHTGTINRKNNPYIAYHVRIILLPISLSTKVNTIDTTC